MDQKPTPELSKLNHRDAVKQSEPTNDIQACASGGVSANISGVSSSDSYQFNAKRENAFLLAQLLNSNKISPAVRQKAEAKMLLLLDDLI